MTQLCLLLSMSASISALIAELVGVKLNTKSGNKPECTQMIGLTRFCLISRISMPGCLVLMAFCGNLVIAAEVPSKHALAAQHQNFDDDTVINQSFSATGLLYRYQFSKWVGLDLEYFRLSGDRKGNLYRLGASGAVPLGRVHLNYGGSYYQQELDNLASDPGDTGFKLMAGLGYEFRQFSLDLNYFSEDVEGADPDDPGDYVELERIEFNVRYSPLNSPWSLEYKYIDSGSDYSANALAVKFRF